MDCRFPIGVAPGVPPRRAQREEWEPLIASKIGAEEGRLEEGNSQKTEMSL